MRVILQFILFFIVYGYSFGAGATSAGDPCTSSGATTTNGAAELVCNGSTWQLAYQIQNTGQISFGSGFKLSTNGTCSGSTEGVLRWNSTDKTPEYCNGTSWVGVSGSSTNTDPHWANVVLLIAPSASDTTLVDHAGNYSPSLGAATLDSAVADPWGGTRKYINATSTSLNIPDSNDWNIDQAFTAEVWAQVASVSGSPIFFGQGDNGTTNTAWQLQYSGSTPQGIAWINLPGWANAGSVTSTASYNTWHHFALVADGSGNMMFYKDGVQSGSTYSGAYPMASPLALTIANGNKVAAVRITRGIARTPSEFMISNPPN